MKPTHPPRANDVDLVFVEAALREICGARTPPDPSGVLQADGARRAAAARNLDEAARLLRRHPARRRLWAAAALLAVAAGTALAWPWSRAAAPGATAPLLWSQSAGDVVAAPQPQASREFTAYLDRFHQVMPQRPTTLRDAAARRRIAPVALPLLRQIDDFLQQRGDGEPSGRQSQFEFRIYALALGDAVMRERVQQLTQTDANTAALLFAAADLIRAGDAAERAAALHQLQGPLRRDSPAGRAAVRCLCIAGDLGADEAAVLAAAAADPGLAASLRDAADWAAKDPRQRLGAPLVLQGTGLDGSELSSADLRGKVVLVHFWTSTARTCDFALPEILRLRIKYPATDLAILGVSCDGDPQALHDFLTHHPELCWPQFYDADQPGWHALARSLGVHAVPRVFLIDRNGVLRSVDAQDNLAAEVQRLVRE